MDTLRLSEIEQMNKDLKLLLMNLPKPLLLIKTDTKEAVLANLEATNLLSI